MITSIRVQRQGRTPSRLKGFSAGILLAAASIGAAWSGSPAYAAGLQVSVTPPSIDWRSNTWVTVAVSNLSPGAEVQLNLYVDVDGNGSAHGADQLLASYRIKDGVTNPLGASAIVDDEDGAANGRTASRISYFSQDGPLHIVGRYVWQARTVGDGPATAGFSVTQSAGSAWITGMVIDYMTSNAIPGAAVTMECFHKTESPGVWTDTNGAFRLDLPPGVSTADVQSVSARGIGYFCPSAGLDGGDPVAHYAFADDLQVGENPLPTSLRVVGAIPGDIHVVSGHVYDEKTNAVPGVIVQAEWGDEDYVVAVTDTNGAYSMTVPSLDIDEEASIYTDPDSLLGKGFVAVGQGLVLSSDLSDVDFYCPRATLLARGRILAADNGEPLVGVTVSIEGGMFGGHGVSATDGAYEVALSPYDNYGADVWGLEERGFLEPPEVEGLSITDNSVTNLDFLIERCYPVTGVVFDQQTNRMTGGTIGAFRYAEVKFWEWEVNTDVNRHGDFRLLAPTGELVMVVVGVPGCAGVVYPDHAYGEWDNNHEADLISNTPAGASGVDFYLSRYAHIQGVVLGNGHPLEGISVSASAVTDNGWEWRAWCDTDVNGFYSIEVAPGSNYAVKVSMPDNEGMFWLPQYYDHMANPWEVTLVTTAVDAPATNIDFELTEGCIISGWVFQQNGTTPVVECEVKAETLDGDEVSNGDTDNNGYYEIIVPPGEYHVYARGSHASYGVDMFYPGVFDDEFAEAVTGTVSQVTSNINFSLDPGATISGRVTEDDGSTPIPWCPVEAQRDGDGMADVGSDEDGYYSIRLPPGTYTLVARPEWDGLPYVGQYYSNAMYQVDAIELTVDSGDALTGIDFQLQQASMISGYIYQGDGTTPLGNCHVFATDYDSNDWIAGVNSENDGSYTLQVPPGTYRVRTYPAAEGLLYESKFYGDTFSYAAALPVVVSSSNDAAGIDFVLQRAGFISGRIYGGDTPLADCHIGAEDATTGDWMAYGWSDDNGYYRLVLPEGSYRVRVVPSVSGLVYADLYYNGTPNWYEATPVAVIGTNETSGIDFHLGQPGHLQGRVTDKGTGEPIAGMSVSVGIVPDPMMNRDYWIPFGSHPTDSNGCYSAPVPAGDNYLVQTEPGNSYYPFRCWSNQTDRWQATLLSVGSGVTVSNIDFELEAGGRITGCVVREDNGAPLSDCDVTATDYETDVWLAGVRTDASGYYSLAVPAGTTYRVATAPHHNNLPYQSEYFDDTLNWFNAQEVAVTLFGETGGIDFTLMLENMTYEDWKDHYFTPAELANAAVGADDADPDEDGASNEEEFVADTNPRLSNSVLRVTGHGWEDGALRIDWKGGRWAQQILQRCDKLPASEDDWIAIHTIWDFPTTVTNSAFDWGAPYLEPKAFYRIKVERY